MNASWLQHPNGICLKQLSEINGIYKQIYIYLGNPPPYLSTKSLKWWRKPKVCKVLLSCLLVACKAGIYEWLSLNPRAQKMSLWKHVHVKDLVILVLTKLHAGTVTNQRWREICGSDYQNWEKSSQSETINCQHCHSNTWWITQVLEKTWAPTCFSSRWALIGRTKVGCGGGKRWSGVREQSPPAACMWWCFRWRTPLCCLQESRGENGAAWRVSREPWAKYPHCAALGRM